MLNEPQGGDMKTESEGMTVRLWRDSKLREIASLQGIPNPLLNAVQILLEAAESRARAKYLIREVVPQAVEEIVEKRRDAVKEIVEIGVELSKGAASS